MAKELIITVNSKPVFISRVKWDISGQHIIANVKRNCHQKKSYEKRRHMVIIVKRSKPIIIKDNHQLRKKMRQKQNLSTKFKANGTKTIFFAHRLNIGRPPYPRVDPGSSGQLQYDKHVNLIWYYRPRQPLQRLVFKYVFSISMLTICSNHVTVTRYITFETTNTSKNTHKCL